MCRAQVEPLDEVGRAAFATHQEALSVELVSRFQKATQCWHLRATVVRLRS